MPVQLIMQIVWIAVYALIVLTAFSMEAVSDDGMNGEFLGFALIGWLWPLAVAGAIVWTLGWSYMALLRHAKRMPMLPLLCSFSAHDEVVVDTWTDPQWAKDERFHLGINIACRRCPYTDRYVETSESRAHRRIAGRK